MRVVPIISALIVLVVVIATATPVNAQRFRGMEPFNERPDDPKDGRLGAPEFTFVRGKYTNYSAYSGGMSGPGRGWWETDFEDSDRNFLRGVRRYTKLDANSWGFKALDLTDPELFEHTFVYINMKRIPINVAGSGPNFTPEEATALREFMMRGGFVMFDDFWGQQHWEDFLIEFIKIFPDRELQKLDTNHAIFHSFFDINEFTQVPGRSVTWNYGSGFYLDDPDYPPSVHGVLDDDGRVMMVVNFNTDLGDGWEHTFYDEYPTKYCNEAYKLGINYIIYAMSH